jgi:crotonobetainyl-CoA:carnitine CoA-transferase CaiB-like acyl-CoA transferase
MIQEDGDPLSPNRYLNTPLPHIEGKVPIFYLYELFLSISYLKVNRNKKSVALSFKHPESLAIINKIIDSSDILVENYIPGNLQKYGLDYNTVSKRKPELIYASVTGISLHSSLRIGYGQTGPYATRAGYDVMVEAEMGLMHITGTNLNDLTDNRRTYRPSR